jgi:hypothetical protein
MRVFALLLALAAAPATAMQAGEGASPRGEPQAGKVLRDRDFGVTTRHPGLQRHVEMYQWTRAGGGYALAWRGARVDSSGFAPGHDNPRGIPLREREWRAPVTVDGHAVPDDVVAALGSWRPFRPNFSELPGNMSATFQPEGDGLGSADNPLAPQVGDLRVTWRALVLPPLQDRLVLRDGRWALRGGAAAPADAPAPAAVADSGEASPRKRRWALPAGAIVVVLVIVAVATRRRR